MYSQTVIGKINRFKMKQGHTRTRTRLGQESSRKNNKIGLSRDGQLQEMFYPLVRSYIKTCVLQNTILNLNLMILNVLTINNKLKKQMYSKTSMLILILFYIFFFIIWVTGWNNGYK